MNYPTKQEYPSWSLDDRRVEIWCFTMDASAGGLQRLHSVLSTDEKERAARFRFPNHRDAFITARGCLRILLSRYIGGTPKDVQFHYGARGKPSCAGSAIQFNLSHSAGLAIFAFTRAVNLGVDVESIHPIPEMMGLAQRFFCPAEVQDLVDVEESRREHAFFLCWTRKEACIKATGDGLSTELSSFRVSLKPDCPARFLHFDCGAAESWTLHNLELPASYAGALAYRDNPRPTVISPMLSPSWLLDY